MTRLNSLILGAIATLTFSACGSDDSAGTKGGGGNSAATGGSGTGTTGGTATGSGGASATSGGKGATVGGTGTVGSAGSKSTGGATGTTGGSSTGGTGGANSCQQACQKFAAANCGDITAADCATGCGPATTCAAEADAYFGCVVSKGVVSCDTMMQSLVAGCNPEGQAYSVCGACEPSPDDTACGTCTLTTCCTQVKAYSAASDVNGFDACVSAVTCTTQACVDACVAMYPVAGKAYNEAIDCQSDSCANSCICGASDTDTACTACLKGKCCDLVVPYVNASDFGTFTDCLDLCVDQTCLDDCIAKSPIAGAAYDALGANCVDTTCATECAN